MALKDTILDVRNMKRSIQLRGLEDTAQVTALLERILKDAVVAQASGSRTFERKAFNELSQIRQDLVAGQINAGASKDTMVGIYSHLLDQMSNMQQDNKKSSVITDKAFQSLSNSIPSADTFISALMTANPLVGYGVKISRDIMRATKMGMDNQRAEKAKKLKGLKEQELYIKEQLRVTALEEVAAKENLENEEQDKALQKNSLERDVYLNLLEEIRDEMRKLVSEWTGESTTTTLAEADMANPANDPVVEKLDSVDQAILDQSKLEQQIADNELKAMDDLEKSQKRDQKLERLKGSDSKGLDLKPVDDVMGKEKGGFASLLSSLMAPLMLLLRSTLVGFAAAAIGLFTTVIAIPALIATAVYKFLDGFFNAEDIIGKASSDITMLDRVKAGVANIWGTIFKIVDWVTNLFGFDFIDTKNIEKRIYGVFDDAQNKIVSTFHTVVEIATEKLEMIKDTMNKIYDDLTGMVDATWNFISEKYESLTTFFDNLTNKGIVETFRDYISGPAEPMEDPAKSPHRQQDEFWQGDVPLPQAPQTYQGDVPVPGLPEAPKVEIERPTQRIEVPNPILELEGPDQVQPPKNPDPRILRLNNQPNINIEQPLLRVEQQPQQVTPIDQNKIVRVDRNEDKTVNMDSVKVTKPNPKNIDMMPSNGKGISSSMSVAEVNSRNQTSPGSTAIIAPNNTSNNVSNHTYMGPPTTANLEPDFRSMMKGA